MPYSVPIPIAVESPPAIPPFTTDPPKYLLYKPADKVASITFASGLFNDTPEEYSPYFLNDCPRTPNPIPFKPSLPKLTRPFAVVTPSRLNPVANPSVNIPSLFLPVACCAFSKISKSPLDLFSRLSK